AAEILDHEIVERSDSNEVLEEVGLPRTDRETEIIIARSLVPLLHEIEQLHQNTVVDLGIVRDDLLERARVLVVGILQRTDRDMLHDAVIAGAAADHGKEQILASGQRAVKGDRLLAAVGEEYLEGHELVAEQAESAGQLAVAAGLDVTADMHVVALAGRHEE